MLIQPNQKSQNISIKSGVFWSAKLKFILKMIRRIEEIHHDCWLLDYLSSFELFFFFLVFRSNNNVLKLLQPSLALSERISFWLLRLPKVLWNEHHTLRSSSFCLYAIKLILFLAPRLFRLWHLYNIRLNILEKIYRFLNLLLSPTFLPTGLVDVMKLWLFQF